MLRTSLALALWLAAAGLCHAQSEVEWKQTINMPKGASMPRDRADILGIELGDTYADAKAKLLKLFDEGIQRKPAPPEAPKPPARPRTVYDPLPDTPPPIVPVAEEKSIFRLQPPGSQLMWTASYVAKLKMKRDLKGVTDRNTEEEFTVYLSSPASGHQVIGIERRISYRSEGDQPRASDIITQAINKMQAQPHIKLGSDGYYTFQFDNGKSVPFNSAPSACWPQHRTTDAQDVPRINTTGTCDAIFLIQITFGISRDHVKDVSFTLSDNERAKANLNADFAYVRDYIRGLGERTRGAPPKL